VAVIRFGGTSARTRRRREERGAQRCTPVWIIREQSGDQCGIAQDERACVRLFQGRLRMRIDNRAVTSTSSSSAMNSTAFIPGFSAMAEVRIRAHPCGRAEVGQLFVLVGATTRSCSPAMDVHSDFARHTRCNARSFTVAMDGAYAEYCVEAYLRAGSESPNSPRSARMRRQIRHAACFAWCSFSSFSF